MDLSKFWIRYIIYCVGISVTGEVWKGINVIADIKVLHYQNVVCDFSSFILVL